MIELDEIKPIKMVFTGDQLEHVAVVRDILNELLKGRVEQFESMCKFCNKPIMMRRIDGENWKPISKKSGEKHSCKKGRAYYKKLKKEQSKNEV